MRVYYDDEMAKEFVVKLGKFIGQLRKNTEPVSTYMYGRMETSAPKLRDWLRDKFSKNTTFSIGKACTSANGIGNNNRYPVYFDASPNEKQICCYININSGLYGEAYVYCDDYDEQRITATTTIRGDIVKLG